MKIRFPFVAVAFLVLCVPAPPALAGKHDAASPGGPVLARRVAVCNSAGLQGPQDLTPFVNVARSVELSDTTGSDTLETSTMVWAGKPLYRLVKAHESRADVTGPTDLTVTTMAPFKSPDLGFKMDYTMSIRMDEGDAQVLDLHTQRANPLYTTRVHGMTFGEPKAFLVAVPAGRHSVYLKPVDGPLDFLYAVFHETAPPLEDLRK